MKGNLKMFDQNEELNRDAAGNDGYGSIIGNLKEDAPAQQPPPASFGRDPQ